MQASNAVKTFTDRYPIIGPAMWMLSIQYYLTQIVVAASWKVHYSLAHNTISDLGNTSCGLYGGRFVCSPLHGLMNASFITLGIFMATGSLLVYQEFKERIGTLVGFSFMAIAGIGTLLVGTFPENTINILHFTGALLPFFVGNVGIVILGFTLDIPKPLRLYTLVSGFIALISLIFFVTHTYLGIGTGGMERLTAYPQTMWLIVFGIYISKNHIMKRLNNHSTKR
jgi:hypothetical membrane protein